MTRKELEAHAQEMCRYNKENMKTIQRLEAEIKVLRNEETDDRMCPFMNNTCARDACAVYNLKVKDCNIQVLSYNVYKLNRAIEEIRSSNKQSQVTVED